MTRRNENMKFMKANYIVLGLAVLFTCNSSCKKLVEVNAPITSSVAEYRLQ